MLQNCIAEIFDLTPKNRQNLLYTFLFCRVYLNREETLCSGVHMPLDDWHTGYRCNSQWRLQ